MSSGITNVQGNLTIFIWDNNSLISSGFDKLCVEKSFNGPSGTYQEITAVTAASAKLISAKKELFLLNGLEFKFHLNGVEKTAMFTTEQTAVQVAAKIQADTGAPSSAFGDGYVQIASTTTGLGSTLEIRSSTAGGVALGFYKEAWDIGEIARPSLEEDTWLYTLVDYHTDADYWYRWRAYSTTGLVYSDYSGIFQARAYGAVDPANLIYGTAQIMDSEGNPMRNLAVLVTHRKLEKSNGKIIDGWKLTYFTDSEGKVAIPLIKGSNVVVAVENTRLARDIIVPSTGTSFDLFDPSVQGYDAFGIVSYNISDMERSAF